MRALLILLALVASSEALAADPTQRQWRENREGRAAFEAGDFESAREHFARRVEMAPDDPRAHFNLGNALASLGIAEEAEAAWSEAARLAGEGALARDARFNQGVAALGSGAHDVAVRRLAEALALDPEDADARRNLELALRHLQQEQQQQPSPPDDSGKKQSEDEQRQDQSQQREREQNEQEQQQQEQGQQPEQQQEQGQQPEQKEGQDETPQDASGDQQGGDPQPPSPDRGTPAESGADEDEKEQARRVLERLAGNEKDALEKDLKRRIEAESTAKKKGKRW